MNTHLTLTPKQHCPYRIDRFFCVIDLKWKMNIQHGVQPKCPYHSTVLTDKHIVQAAIAVICRRWRSITLVSHRRFLECKHTNVTENFTDQSPSSLYVPLIKSDG